MQKTENCNVLAGVSVRTFSHLHLNSCWSAIRTTELYYMEEAEIATELKEQGVTNVKRIT